MKDVLILGGTGFVGHHMKKACPKGYRVTAVGRATNICDKKSLRNIIELVNPSVVINLASITTISESYNNPRLCYEVSFIGMLNLLEVLEERKFTGKLLYSSSSEVYGHPDTHALPICETYSPLSAMSPYSVAKISAEYLCQYWNKQYGLNTIIVRPFTHIGPGQSDHFSISNFAKQVANIILEKNEPIIFVGNLNTTRDLTDVRDIVRAYWSLIERGHKGEIYNVCSGIERKIEDVLKELIFTTDISIQVISEPLSCRSNDLQRMKGSSNKIKEHIGWKPEIKFSDTLNDMIKYWKDAILINSIN